MLENGWTWWFCMILHYQVWLHSTHTCKTIHQQWRPPASHSGLVQCPTNTPSTIFGVFWASQLSPLPICLQDLPRLTNQKWLVVEHWTPRRCRSQKISRLGSINPRGCQGKSPQTSDFPARHETAETTHRYPVGYTATAGQRSYRHLQVNSKRSHLAAMWSATSPIRQQLSCRKAQIVSVRDHPVTVARQGDGICFMLTIGNPIRFILPMISMAVPSHQKCRLPCAGVSSVSSLSDLGCKSIPWKKWNYPKSKQHEETNQWSWYRYNVI